MTEKKQNIPASDVDFIDKYNGHISVPWYLYLNWLGKRTTGGEAGPQGPEGPVGPQGPQGPKGETGPQGERGEQGEKGEKGDKGDKGDVGDVGPQGPQGDVGPVGPQGPKGDKGDEGDIDRRITNCITEIPQDIKLQLGGTKTLYAWTTENDTLYTDTTQAGAYDIRVYNASGQNVTPAKGTIYISSDGTYIWCDVDTISKHYRDASSDKIIDYKSSLVLKAGSKVYVPNGFESNGTTPKFDVVTIANDLALTQDWGTAEQLAITVSQSGTYLARTGLNRCTSGTTAPTQTNYRWWYDTSSNKIKEYSGGAWNNNIVSFPIAIVTVPGDVTSTVTSIDQVFNGFGYIGSTLFALPGVKGLVPNGRNEDGTLNSIEFTTSKILTKTDSGTFDFTIMLNANNLDNYINYTFDAENNYNLNSNGNIIGHCVAGTFIRTDGGISNFQPKQPFHAVDYNDTEFIAHQAMPSNNYIDLTLGENWAGYNAPADGYFFLQKDSAKALEAIRMVKTNASIGTTVVAPTSGFGMYISLPVSKGDRIQIAYNATGATKFFRFVYANGAKH